MTMAMLTEILFCALIVTVCVQIVVIRHYRLRNAELRRELAEATDWIDPIVIGEPTDED
ncbi:MAG: hypothetical protein IK149_01630 [Oscillospiraceae bacterium]|nr:hypothetical protein [Oscillospiraceae bacterium]